MLNIEQPFMGRYAFLHTGFRPFFAAAALGAALLMLIWMGIFGLGVLPLTPSYSMISWHGYEMIYGFGLAVAAGFLLTAVKNWTHETTLEGYPLLALALVWLLARVLPLLPGVSIIWPALLELGFIAGLLVAVTRPIVRVKQWGQMAIVGKLALLLPASAVFHLGVAGVWPPGISVGLYAGFYILLGLVLTLARRVMPMFIERGINNGFMIRNNASVDRWCLVLFLLFGVADTLLQVSFHSALAGLVSLLAFALFGLHAWRLRGWYHHAVWQKPMVWVLVLAYIWVIVGFFVKAWAGIGDVSQSIAVHAFAVGGVGLVTLGMMARVSLGHTGRNVNVPPPGVGWVFGLIGAAAMVRVFGVWLIPNGYQICIVLAQLLWISGFGLFAWIYLPMWIRARLDGGRG